MLKIDAEGVARGLIDMMNEIGDKDVTLIRFGMLPKRWMDMVERQMNSVIRDRFSLTPGRDEYSVICKPSHEYDDYHVETFKISSVVSEMVHAVALALYGSVDMVV